MIISKVISASDDSIGRVTQVPAADRSVSNERDLCFSVDSEFSTDGAGVG
jgi:hypothetical protein